MQRSSRRICETQVKMEIKRKIKGELMRQRERKKIQKSVKEMLIPLLDKCWSFLCPGPFCR